MSEINCFCDEQPWGEVLPGIHLVRLRNVRLNTFGEAYIAGNGVAAHELAFGLTISNDPFLIFPFKPTADPHWGRDDEWDNMPERVFRAAMARVERIRDRGAITGDFDDLGALWDALKAAGWNQDEHGFAALFLYHRVGEYIKTHTPNRRRWRPRLGA